MQEASPKGYILYDSIYMTFWKRYSYRGGEQSSGCQELRVRRGLNGEGLFSTRESVLGGEGVIELLCILIAAAATQFYAFVKTDRTLHFFLSECYGM